VGRADRLSRLRAGRGLVRACPGADRARCRPARLTASRLGAANRRRGSARAAHATGRRDGGGQSDRVGRRAVRGAGTGLLVIVQPACVAGSRDIGGRSGAAASIKWRSARGWREGRLSTARCAGELNAYHPRSIRFPAAEYRTAAAPDSGDQHSTQYPAEPTQPANHRGAIRSTSCSMDVIRCATKIQPVFIHEFMTPCV
jgi:hypothetical protein